MPEKWNRIWLGKFAKELNQKIYGRIEAWRTAPITNDRDTLLTLHMRGEVEADTYVFSRVQCSIPTQNYPRSSGAIRPRRFAVGIRVPVFYSPQK